MNRFAYRIHYSNDPRRIGNVEMGSEEVCAALARFREDLPRYMSEMGARAELSEPMQGPMRRHASSLRIKLHTRLDWAQASVAIGRYAERHGLRATHVANALWRDWPKAEPAAAVACAAG
jgi:hypothetical protein